MGKGARERAKRKRSEIDSKSRDQLRTAIGELLLVEDFATYSRLLLEQPLLLHPAATDELTPMLQSPGYGPLFARTLLLLEQARVDPVDAWTVYSRAAERAATVGEELATVESRIQRAMSERNHAGALALIADMLPVAAQSGHGSVVSRMLGQRGIALYELNTANRADELDAAIVAFEAALEVSVPGPQAASLFMHLGLALGERVNGDRADNLEHAVAAMRFGLEQLDGADDPEFRAMMQTNLALGLLRGERGDRQQLLTEAASLCREALAYRTPQRDADNWAYSMLNLAYVLRDLAGVDEPGSTLDECRAAFDAVVEHGDQIDDESLVGVAHQGLGRLSLQLTRRSAEDMVAMYEVAGVVDIDDSPDDLLVARGHLEIARRLTSQMKDRLRYARILDDLSETLEKLGDDGPAIEAAYEAVSILRPTTDPVACLSVSWRLGRLLSERGEWADAASAYRMAVDAAEFTFHGRMGTASRATEAQRSGNLYRWAAYAIARAGDAAGAALVLETGRGRELQRRLGLDDLDDAVLAQVPVRLRDELRAAVATLAVTPMDPDDDRAPRRVQELLNEIRKLPGLHTFASGPQLPDIAVAIEPGWPIVYVNPAPTGTVLLCAADHGDGIDVQATFIDGTTSEDVVARLMIGEQTEAEFAEGTEFGSYLFGISGEGGPDRNFRLDLDAALPWLGDRVARPLNDVLTNAQARGVTLVLAGPIGATPLHAAPWQDGEHLRYLIDKFEVRFAPSAIVCAAAQRRAARAKAATPFLVALGDPCRDLPAAGPEIAEIAALFPTDRHETAFGASADEQFLLSHAGEATHLHLACHARGGLFDPSDAAIQLASGLMSVDGISLLGGMRPRLVVVSACQSAQSAIAGLPEEVRSIATAMLASGSACCIASLWSVDDLATALLMTRLYTEMLIHDLAPPEALRRVQLWLRGLTVGEERAFLDRHPTLAAEYRRRIDRGDLPGRRSYSSVATPTAGPYSHPDYWAPFVAVGA